MAAIRVDGMRELQRGIRRAADREMPKRLGEAHKEVGRFVIDRLQPRPDPAAVGAGAGAKVRPSATKREVLLRVGGKHRTNPPMQQWGKRPVGGFRAAPPRPHIIGTVERHQQAIEEKYLDAVMRAVGPEFASWKAR
jgi:hypothetical protein